MKYSAVLAAMICFSTAWAKTQTDAVPSPEALYAEIGPELVVLKVDKKGLKATLETIPPHGKQSQILTSFTIAIGKELGDKQVQGDNKTPEGVYFTQSVIDGAKLPPKYGPYAIPLDYPNPIDKKDGKTGYGIWLHGVIKDERVEKANVTEGCVAFYNADIVKLTQWLMPHQGLVVIADDDKEVNQTRDLQAVHDATQAWISAWAQRDLDAYTSAYHSEFRDKGRNLTAYSDYKKRVFSSYKVMKVSVDNVRIITHPKYAVAIMDQDFFGDERFTSIGRKILYWRKLDDGSWRIMREVYENRRVEFVQLDTAPNPTEETQAAMADPEQDDGQSKL